MVCPQVVAAVKEKHRPVAAVELDEIVAADDVARVVGHCDDEIEDDIVGQHVEEVLTVHECRKAFLDYPKERIQCTEVVHVLDHSVPPGNRWQRMILGRRYTANALVADGWPGGVSIDA